MQVYAELEQRVNSRTIELQCVNQKLVAEIQERRVAEEAVHRLSLTDELTKLHNRRGFFLLAEQQLKLAHRLGTAFNVLFGDIDGLKRINDLQGHEVGDAVICAAAAILKETFRESDILARLGGDEFVVLAPGTTADWDKRLKRLQFRVNQFNRWRKAPFVLSMSVGAHPYYPDETKSLEEILVLADSQMLVQPNRLGNRMMNAVLPI